MKTIRKPRRTGAMTVEFAFAIPVLVLFILAFFEIGRALTLNCVLENAAYEGARQAILPGATEGRQQPAG